MTDYGPEERYRIYAVRDDDPRTPVLLATAPDAEALGVALVTLDSDAREAGGHVYDDGAIGVLDGLLRRWLILPWSRSTPGA